MGPHWRRITSGVFSFCSPACSLTTAWLWIVWQLQIFLLPCSPYQNALYSFLNLSSQVAPPQVFGLNHTKSNRYGVGCTMLTSRFLMSSLSLRINKKNLTHNHNKNHTLWILLPWSLSPTRGNMLCGLFNDTKKKFVNIVYCYWLWVPCNDWEHGRPLCLHVTHPLPPRSKDQLKSNFKSE